jgi:inosine-uridine nucleoside N-ribohydrolase
MKKVVVFVLFFCFCWGHQILKAQTPAKPVKIIFDTDMGPDFDDVGAITILHALAAKGECEILATLASDGYPYIASTLEVFNRYFKNTDYPSATEVYRKVLAKQPDQSVVIVTVGFLSNLVDLLKSGPDQFSPLSGKELVAKKVKKWVAMAGGFPEGNEFNVNQHAKASEYVFQNWPTPILFSGFEIGVKIMTGNKVASKGTKGSPVQWAYQYCLSNYENRKSENRNSWDHTAVLCAVRNPENYFYVIGNGTFVCNPDGSNTWNPDKNSSHSFLVHKYPYQKIADILDDLMLFEPK